MHGVGQRKRGGERWLCNLSLGDTWLRSYDWGNLKGEQVWGWGRIQLWTSQDFSGKSDSQRLSDSRNKELGQEEGDGRVEESTVWALGHARGGCGNSDVKHWPRATDSWHWAISNWSPGVKWFLGSLRELTVTDLVLPHSILDVNGTNGMICISTHTLLLLFIYRIKYVCCMSYVYLIYFVIQIRVYLRVEGGHN